MIEAKGVSYRYDRDQWVMKKLNLTVQPGEVVGLYGKSGSGKTTLSKIMAGYLKPMEGHVRIDGEMAPKKGVHPVQLVWQHPEKAINPRWRLGETLREGWEPDDELLRALGIEKAWLKRWPSELSGGELQRICLARALGPSTRYLIADEMTTMLDAITQAQIWHVVLDLVKHRNIGVLAVSHDMDLLEKITTRMIDFNTIATR